MFRIVYSSVETEPMTDKGLEGLLRHARSANRARNVTGMLLYADRGFIQVLEGDKSDIDKLVAKIEADSRHDRFEILLAEEIDACDFADWEMAYLTQDQANQEIGGMEGVKTHGELSDRLRQNRSYVGAFLKRSVERLFVPAQ